jgi:hypothetical protein
MRRVRLASLAAVAAISFTSIASAADMPVKAPVDKAIAPIAYSWAGWYVGGNVGYAWGHSDAVTSAECGTFVPFYFVCGNQAVVQASGTGSLSPKGVTGGIQAGYNWQTGHLVYGAELDFGAFSLKGSRAGTSAYVANAPGVPFTTSSSVETDWLFTARGRLGWIGRKNDATSVELVVKNPDAAKKAGIMPKPGKARVLFGNINAMEAAITFNKRTLKVAAGAGTKHPDGPMLDLAPGKYKYSIKLPGRPPQSDEVVVGADETWGLMIGPGGVLALQAY